MAVVAVVLGSWSGDLHAARGTPGQWNLATGICGTVVDLATQGYTGYVFAAVQSQNQFCAGVYRSSNGGASFSKVGITYPGYSQPTIFDLSNGPGAAIYAATSAGIWRTYSETMVTWERLTNGFPVNEYGVVLGWIYMVDWVWGSNEFYATFDPEALNGGGLYRSTDGGSSWTLVQPGLDAVSVNHGMQCGGTGNLTVVAAARPDRGGLAGGLWVSRDGGVTWARSLTWPTARAMDAGIDCSGNQYINKNFTHIFVTNGDPTVNAAVYRSTDLAQTFVPDNQGIPTCCGSTIRDDRLGWTLGNVVGSWAPTSGGDGLYTRNIESKIGAAWSKYTANGLPFGAAIADWVYTPDPATGIFQYVVIVNGGIYYKR
jgi:hypothetical protein